MLPDEHSAAHGTDGRGALALGKRSEARAHGRDELLDGWARVRADSDGHSGLLPGARTVERVGMDLRTLEIQNEGASQSEKLRSYARTMLVTVRASFTR